MLSALKIFLQISKSKELNSPGIKIFVHVWTMETINMYISRVILEPLLIMEKHAVIINFSFFIQSCPYYMAKYIHN